MDNEVTSPVNTSKLQRDLSRDAIALALKGEWERASEVNRTVLALCENDADSMNRLGKALMELAQYKEAREVLGRVIIVAPYNNIAKKNLARLDHLENNPASASQGRKAGGTPQLFIEESGKSGTTLLKKAVTGQVAARIAPSDTANLVVENDAINIYTRDGEYLGQIEPKLGRRLIRLIQGGNQYQAAVIGVGEQGISMIIRETYRHRNLQNVCSFPTKTKEEHRVYLGDNLARYTRNDDTEEDEGVIEEGELETSWSEDE